MDHITKTTKTVFPTTRSKNNHPPQHSRSFTTAITSANPSLVQNLGKNNNLCWLQSGKLSRCYHFDNIKYALMGQGELSYKTNDT